MVVFRKLRSVGAFACIGVFVASLTGCSDSADQPQFAVLERYVELLGAGNFDGANALRCNDARVDARAKEQFLNEVTRFESSAGVPLAVVDIEVLDDPKLRPINGEARKRELQFRLQTTEGTSEPVRVVTVMEGAKEVLCGYANEASFAVRDLVASATVSSVSQPVADPKRVLGVVGELHATSPVTVDEVPRPAGITPELVEAWGTSWKKGEFGGARINAYRFADVASAKTAAAEFLARRSVDGTATFTVPSMPHATGLRHVASAWTWLQPAGLGDHADLVVAVYDDVLVWISTSPVPAADDHAWVNSIANEFAK